MILVNLSLFLGKLFIFLLFFILYFILQIFLVLVCDVVRYSFPVSCPMSDLLAHLYWLWMCDTHGFTHACLRDGSISAFNLEFGSL